MTVGFVSRNKYLEKRGWKFQYKKKRGMIVQIAWHHPDHGTQWQGTAISMERMFSRLAKGKLS